MSARVKSIIIILLTLMIGFAGGFVTQKELQKRHIKEMRERMHKSGGYTEFIKRMLELNEEQDAQITPILEDYAPRMHEHYREFRRQSRELTDSLAVELSPHLNENQIEKLKKHFSRRRRGPKKSGPR